MSDNLTDIELQMAQGFGMSAEEYAQWRDDPRAAAAETPEARERKREIKDAVREALAERQSGSAA